jgi:hypothetical protein
MDVGELFAGLEIDKDLVVAFFVVFARFEFALKESGYVVDQQGHTRKPWRRSSTTHPRRNGPSSRN